MPAEDPFRIALLVMIVLTVPVATYHRRRAASTGERISHKEEGYLFAAVLRSSGLALWVSTIAFLLSPATVQWSAMPLPAWLRWTGILTGAISWLLILWTLTSLGKNITDTVVTRSNATLVTHGPYRWVRHPFYVTVGMLMLSMTLLSANGLIGVSSFVVLMLLAIRTPKEEQMLINRFGDDYRNYLATTGRFFPRVKSRGTP